MSWLIGCLSLAIAMPEPSLQEAKAFVESLAKTDRSEKCRNCPEWKAPTEPQKLLVFISFSVPTASWIDWSKELEKRGGVFVLRGLPKNSFQLFAQKIMDLRNSGVNAPVIIDPEAFQMYSIDRVPTVVLREGEKYHKLAGNLSLEAVLRRFNLHNQ